MKKQISKKVIIPNGIICEISEGKITFKKDSNEYSKDFNLPKTELNLEGQELTVSCKKGNKLDYKNILSLCAHLRNIISGLENPFEYKLESCNVHFPMSLKIEQDKLEISNFLGEKVKRYAEILPSVKVDIKGNNITITSIDIESAGQTAANFEKATKVKGRDNRIFQDGIYITEKPSKRKNLELEVNTENEIKSGGAENVN
jgi:large subunit ribosomal protein L6